MPTWHSLVQQADGIDNLAWHEELQCKRAVESPTPTQFFEPSTAYGTAWRGRLKPNFNFKCLFCNALRAAWRPGWSLRRPSGNFVPSAKGLFEFLDSLVRRDYKVCNIQVLQLLALGLSALIEAGKWRPRRARLATSLSLSKA